MEGIPYAQGCVKPLGYEAKWKNVCNPLEGETPGDIPGNPWLGSSGWPRRS